MSISYTSLSTTADVRTAWDPASPSSSSDIWEHDALKGRYVQFQLTDSRIDDLDRWVPLGRVDHLKAHPDELRSRFENADTDSDTDEFTDSVCSEEIYR